MGYDKDLIKNSLTINQVFDFITDMGGDPIMMNGFLISKSICHNPAGEGHYKLYYYENTHLFKCYTQCAGDSFDIFQLTRKIKNIENKKWQLPQAIEYVAIYFGFSPIKENQKEGEVLLDWDFFKTYDKINQPIEQKKVELKVFDGKFLNHMPHPIILPWEKQGITAQVMQYHNICYDPVNFGIVIPHYDMDGNLIGIRERTLIKDEETSGKYKPAFLNGKMYNHPLSFALYNLNWSKDNIRTVKKAIVFEGQKSCLIYASIFGRENDISVACCGSSLIAHQVKLLCSLGVEEIILAFDKQFQQIGDDEFKRWTKKLTDINKKYSSYATISFMFDKKNILLEYKDSPIDKGKDIFLQLYKERIMI